MPSITDDIGVWFNLGAINVTQNWIKFPNTATGANATIRLSFNSPSWNKLNSYILIRPRYKTSNSDQVGQAQRVYPVQNLKIVLQVPIPEDFQERSIYFRDFEVKKVLRYRRRIGYTPDAELNVTLEELWG
ncbi:hypothetical protein NIES2101_23965 [Calothrix sp. HK-06]|nr:hypothetical protein NIES2101_23830 [Calothrix sp. HK-06]OKH47324.1 hypothetical protein NIES2101_23965 [Calothrix sp. HK-06]